MVLRVCLRLKICGKAALHLEILKTNVPSITVYGWKSFTKQFFQTMPNFTCNLCTLHNFMLFLLVKTNFVKAYKKLKKYLHFQKMDWK